MVVIFTLGLGQLILISKTKGDGDKKIYPPPSLIMICPYCKKEFTGRQNKIYCSCKCKIKAKNKRLKKWKKRRGRDSKLKIYREIILSIFGKKCQKCNSFDKLNIHHLIPIFLGGNHNIKNITVLCEKCHCQFHREEKIL